MREQQRLYYNPRPGFGTSRERSGRLFQTLPDGRLLRANQAFADMYGYASADEIVAESYDIGAQLYADPEDWYEMIETLTSEGWLAGRECPMVRRDGTRFWASVAIRRVLDDNGALLYYEGTHVDITERRQAEDALRESRNKAGGIWLPSSCRIGR